jgi:hypothetical protein
MKSTEQLNKEKAELLKEIERKNLEREVKELRKKAGKQGLIEWSLDKLAEILSTDKETSK